MLDDQRGAARRLRGLAAEAHLDVREDELFGPGARHRALGWAMRTISAVPTEKVSQKIFLGASYKCLLGKAVLTSGRLVEARMATQGHA